MKKRSTFNLTHENKLSCQMGQLVPILNLEVLPGDTFTGKTDALVRLAPQLAPVMHNVDVFVHYFFVPNRILWDNGKADCWETFITGGQSGTESPAFPKINFSNIANNSLADYLGLPTVSNLGTPLSVSALPFRAYNLIYNEWYRDQNLEDEIAISTAGGDDSTTATNILYRNWEKDYFTSALPSAQRGNGSSIPLTGNIPLTGEVPVIGNGNALGLYASNTVSGTPISSIGVFKINGESGVVTSSEQLPFSLGQTASGTGFGNYVENTAIGVSTATDQSGLKADISNLEADLSNVSAVDIRDLRNASAVQRWLEKSMRFGSRYVEQILSFFGVKSPDARLQRPEYIGGGRSPVLFSEVLQTSSSDDTSLQTVQGNMSGHAFSTFKSNKFKYFATEHGIILGILSILPRTNYQQGVAKKWTRFNRYSYFFPEFQNIGEQEVLNQELYYADDNQNANVFGYQQRYAEYKMLPSEVHGDFRTTLNYWHMGRIFENRPQLNSEFITANPTTRIFAYENADTDNIYIQALNTVIAKRCMAKYSRPSLK